MAKWWTGDVADHDFVARLFRRIQPAVVYHLAGAVSARADLALVLPTFDTLLRGAINVLACAAGAPQTPRVVLIGSLTEPDPAEPTAVVGSPYGAAKWAAGVYGRMFHDLFDTRVAICRPTYVYGPGQPAERLIPYVITSLLKGEPPVLSSGRLTTDFVYVDDVAEGLAAAADARGLDGAAVDLGSGQSMTVRELVLELVRLTHSDVQPRFGEMADRPLERHRAADTEGAAARLGWRAATSLEEGLIRSIEWYRARLEACDAVPALPPAAHGRAR